MRVEDHKQHWDCRDHLDESGFQLSPEGPVGVTREKRREVREDGPEARKSMELKSIILVEFKTMKWKEVWWKEMGLRKKVMTGHQVQGLCQEL